MASSVPLHTIVSECYGAIRCQQFQPASLDQRDDFHADLQLQPLCAVVGDLRGEGQSTRELQMNQVVAAMAFNSDDQAMQLIARAGRSIRRPSRLKSLAASSEPSTSACKACRR